MSISLWLGLGAVLALGILFLLYRVEASRRRSAELERDGALARIVTLEKVLALERQLSGLAGAARAEMERRIRELEDRARKMQEGESTEDLFGTNGERSPS